MGAETKPNISKYINKIKNPPNKQKRNKKYRNVSFAYSRCTHACVVYVCVCGEGGGVLLEMRHRVGRSYNMDQDPCSQKHFIGGSTDPGSGSSGP